MDYKWQVKKYKSFPKQRGSDKVVKQFVKYGDAKSYSIALNSNQESRFYVYKIGS